MSTAYWIGGQGYVDFMRYQVRLSVAGWWGAWVEIEASDADMAFNLACDQYVMNGTDSRLMDHVDGSEILETK